MSQATSPSLAALAELSLFTSLTEIYHYSAWFQANTGIFAECMWKGATVTAFTVAQQRNEVQSEKTHL